ncbi:MAG: hypothetical protein HY255_00515 [Betaproteobacteria bacterium]|nr:hypothetical protein [Betaproteobacteria bacterium]
MRPQIDTTRSEFAALFLLASPGLEPEALCYTCTHAIGRADGQLGLQCQLTQTVCTEVCALHERDAGADLPEQHVGAAEEIPLATLFRLPHFSRGEKVQLRRLRNA